MESKLESTLKKSLEIKEEKIAALEARLEESTNLNQQLRQELKTVRKRHFSVILNELVLFLHFLGKTAKNGHHSGHRKLDKGVNAFKIEITWKVVELIHWA